MYWGCITGQGGKSERKITFTRKELQNENPKVLGKNILILRNFILYFFQVIEMPLRGITEVNMNSYIFIAIIVACVIFIIACIVKRRPDLIVDFALRACFGTAGIYLLNLALSTQGYAVNVGINGATILANGLLGLPGFLLLYGLSLYYSYT
jgi:inhibitor of the pro-sigma K processing machinery